MLFFSPSHSLAKLCAPVCKIVIFNPQLWNLPTSLSLICSLFYTYAFPSCLCSLSLLFLYLFVLVWFNLYSSSSQPIFSISPSFCVAFLRRSFFLLMCMTCSQLGIVLMCDSHCDVLCLFSVSKSVEAGETVMLITISNMAFPLLLNVMLPGRRSGPRPVRRH